MGQCRRERNRRLFPGSLIWVKIGACEPGKVAPRVPAGRRWYHARGGAAAALSRGPHYGFVAAPLAIFLEAVNANIMSFLRFPADWWSPAVPRFCRNA